MSLYERVMYDRPNVARSVVFDCVDVSVAPSVEFDVANTSEPTVPGATVHDTFGWPIERASRNTVVRRSVPLCGDHMVSARVAGLTVRSKPLLRPPIS